MIPYLEQPVLPGPLPIHAFGALVAASVFTATVIFRRRVAAAGLDVRAAADIEIWAFIAGFVFAHLFSLVLYFPEKIVEDPWSLLRLWEDVSSFGGMIGGALGTILYLRLRRPDLTSAERWGYLDAVAYVVPFGWAIGRMGCALAHDHPGSVTSFPLAVSLSSDRAIAFIARVYADAGRDLPDVASLRTMGFHDLGWYELLYLGLIVAPLFAWLRRSASPASRYPGWWVVTFCLLYAPARIMIDFLRVADARYLGLTPGQYAAIAMLGGALWLRQRQRHRSVAQTVHYE